jgi:hypothetical protein
MPSDLLITSRSAARTTQTDPEVIALMWAASADETDIDAARVAAQIVRLAALGSHTPPAWTTSVRTPTAARRLTAPPASEPPATRARLVSKLTRDSSADPTGQILATWTAAPDHPDHAHALMDAATALVAALPQAAQTQVLTGAWWAIYGDRVLDRAHFTRGARGGVDGAASADLSRKEGVALGLLGSGLWTQNSAADAVETTRVTLRSWVDARVA